MRGDLYNIKEPSKPLGGVLKRKEAAERELSRKNKRPFCKKLVQRNELCLS